MQTNKKPSTTTAIMLGAFGVLLLALSALAGAVIVSLGDDSAAPAGAVTAPASEPTNPADATAAPTTTVAPALGSLDRGRRSSASAETPTQVPTQAPQPTATQPPPQPTATPVPNTAPSLTVEKWSQNLYVVVWGDVSDSDGTIVQVAVDWGDGLTTLADLEDDEEYEAEHRYTAAGAYLVEITVTDDDGAQATESTLVNVTAREPDSYVLQLSEIDDDVYVYVNGSLVLHEADLRSTSLDLAPLLTDGVNSIGIVLGNADCFAASLTVRFDVNGDAGTPRSYTTGGFNHCGFQLDWEYSIDTATTKVTQVR